MTRQDRFILRDEYILDTKYHNLIPFDDVEGIVEMLNDQEERIRSLSSFWMDVFEEITRAEKEENKEQ